MTKTLSSYRDNGLIYILQSSWMSFFLFLKTGTNILLSHKTRVWPPIFQIKVNTSANDVTSSSTQLTSTLFRLGSTYFKRNSSNFIPQPSFFFFLLLLPLFFYMFFSVNDSYFLESVQSIAVMTAVWSFGATVTVKVTSTYSARLCQRLAEIVNLNVQHLQN